MGPVCPPPNINIYGTDEEYLAHLERLVHGDQIPHNVFKDVNPFNYHPKNLPGDMLYIVESVDSRSHESGYWEKTGSDVRIKTNSLSVGWRSTLEFYQGQVPNGTKTDWVMHVYKLNQTEQKSTLLCRVFHNMNLDWILLEILTAEENNHLSQDSATGSLVVSDNAHRPLQNSESQLLINPIPDYPANGPCNEEYDFLGEDYLEMNDIISSKSSSSVENSSVVSMNSDEYFDSDALLRDIELGSNTVKKLKVSTAHVLTHVITKPPLPDSPRYQGNKQKLKETSVATSNSENHIGLIENLHKPTTVAADTHAGNEKATKQILGTSKEILGPPDALGGERKDVKRVTKISKKFCCFIPF